MDLDTMEMLNGIIKLLLKIDNNLEICLLNRENHDLIIDEKIKDHELRISKLENNSGGWVRNVSDK